MVRRLKYLPAFLLCVYQPYTSTFFIESTWQWRQGSPVEDDLSGLCAGDGALDVAEPPGSTLLAGLGVLSSRLALDMKALRTASS